MSASRIENIIIFFAAALLLLLAFLNLDRLPIRLWDESRLAVSAYEMYRDGFSIVTTFEGKTDLWNTKPPLLIWLQAGLMHIVGPNELAVRIPTAISVFITCISFIFVSKRITNKIYLGVFAAFVLITTSGFNDIHTGRTGDYDALLTMFMTLSAWCFFFAAEQNFKSAKWNIAFFILLSFGVLTKSISPLMLGPGLLLYLLWQMKLKALFLSRSIYIGFLLFLLISLGYYFVREYADPGYLKAVWENDLGGRYSGTLDNHKHSFTYYFENLLNHQMAHHLIYILPGSLLVWLSPNKMVRRMAGYAIVLCLSYYLVISNSQTKLHWYDAPAFPFIAMLVAFFFWQILQTIAPLFKSTRYSELVLFLVLFTLFCLPAYSAFVRQNYKRVEYEWDYNFYYLTHILKKADRGELDLEGYKVAKEEYQANNLFYIQKMKDRGISIEPASTNTFKPGDKVISDEPEVWNFIEKTTEQELLWEKNGGRVKAYLIK